MRYFANFTANNGTSLQRDIEGNNKFDLLARIRHIAMSNSDGNNARWWVEDEARHMVFDESYIPRVGLRYWIYNYIIPKC